MSIESTASGYKVRWRDGAGRNRAKTFPKGEKKQAENFENEVKRAKRLGYLPQLEAGKHTVGEVAAEWWARHGSQKNGRTPELYWQLLNSHVLPTFDSMRLGEVGVAEVEGWLADLDTGVPAKRKALGVLGQIFNYAVRARYTQLNPAQLAVAPKAPDKQPVYCPSPEEVERIRLKLLEKGRQGDACLVSALAYAGMRTQEARILTWDDVKEKTILAHSSKTGRFRAIDKLSPLARDLAEWKLASGGKHINAFPTQTGLEFTKTTWDNWRKRVWNEVAPDGWPPKQLRHGFVSLLLRDPNKSRVYVAQQAGHSLQVQDDTYAHVIGEGTTGDAEAMIRAARAEVFGLKEATG